MPAKKSIPNDNISKALQNIIGQLPAQYRNSDDYLDVVSWNLRWFNYREEQRVKNISQILSVINADLFIFQEIEEGSLDTVADNLRKAGAGYYEVVYGNTGGDQRVAIMYDTEWLRAKDDIREMYSKGEIKTGDNKDAFPRLPLKGYFLVKSPNIDESGFTFQIVGVHLKSQMGDGGSQRRMAAEALTHWLEGDANDVDSDTIIMGDWNKDPHDADWKSIHKMETDGKVKFEAINDPSDFSHLYYKNKNDIGSRLDIVLASSDAYRQMQNKKGNVVQWASISDLVNSADPVTAAEIKAILKDIRDNVSDHMPLHTRFYLQEKGKAPAKKKKAPKKKKTV